MLDYEEGIATAIAIAQKGFLLSDRDNISNENIRADSLTLMFHLVTKRKKGLAEAAAMAAKGVTDSSSRVQEHSFDLMIAVVSWDYGMQEAIAIAEAGMKDLNNEMPRMKSLELMKKLVAKGHGFQEAIAMVEQGLNDKSSVREEAILLLYHLVKNGQGIEIAIKTISQIVSQEKPIGKLIYFLTKSLLEQGKGLKTVIAVAQAKFKEEGYESIVLVKGVIEAAGVQDEVLEDVMTFIRSALQHKFSFFRAEGLQLMQALVDKGYGFQEAITMAQNGMKNSDEVIKASLALMSTLVSKGYGFTEAVEMGKQALASPDQALSELGGALIQLVKEQGYDVPE